MKRLFLILAVIAILISSVAASQIDPRKQLSLEDNSTKPLTQNSRLAPTYYFAVEPMFIMNSYYDYFPGSYNSSPMHRVQTPELDGNWLVFQSQSSISSNRKIYKTFIDNTGYIMSHQYFNADDIREGFPASDITEGGRPLLAFHADLDDEDTALEVGFGYDAVIAGLVLGLDSDLYTIIDNPISINVNGTTVPSNEFLWPSVQVGPSPIAGSQRVYVLGKNAISNGDAISENVIIFYKDFTEQEVENQIFDGTGWESTSIPQLDEWNNSTGEYRRPNMSLIVHEDKVYYIGYHIALTNATNGEKIDEATLTAFVCDNYGSGTWTQHSTYGDFSAINPHYIDPYTGEEIEGVFYFDGITDDMLSNKIGQAGHFNTAIDNYGRIHFPTLYTLEDNNGNGYTECHTVKDIMFDINSLDWSLSEVYPQKENGSEPFVPNDPLDITQYTTTNKYPHDDLWQWWDKDGDGDIDEVLDDGSYDGIDDGITAADTDYWGKPVLTTIWPFMYWDQYAADSAMLFHLNTLSISDANEQGMMAMVWQDANKSRLYNLYPDLFPQNIFYADMCEIVISVSSDNGNYWSEPIFLNGVDTPQMQNEIPEFPYIGSQVDYLGQDVDGNPIGRIYLMYLDDNTYGSSVQNIGQATGGEIKYTAIDVVFANSSVSSTATIAFTDPFNFEEDGELTVDMEQYIENEDNLDLSLNVLGNENISVEIDGLMVTFSANQDWFGAETLTFTISDRSGGGDARFVSSSPVEIVVDPVNDAPTIDLPESFTMPGNGQLQVDMSQYVEDVDGDFLALSITGNEDIFVTIDQLMVTFIPPADWYGTNQITCTVSDGVERASSGLFTNSKSKSITKKVRNNTRLTASATTVLNVLDINNPPTITLPESFTFEENGELTVDMEQYVNDADGDPLTLSVSGNQDILVIINQLVVTFSAPADWYGTNQLTFTVDDGITRTSSESSTPLSKSINRKKITKKNTRQTNSSTTEIIVTSTNQTPTIDLPDSFTFIEDYGLVVEFSFYIEDLDGDALTLTVSGNENISATVEGMVITFATLPNWYGTEEITITVNDNDNRAIASGTTNIIVSPVNDAPMIISYTPSETEIQTTIDSNLDFAVQADDIDSELTYSWYLNNVEQQNPVNQFSCCLTESAIYEIKVVIADEEYSVEQIWNVEVPVHNAGAEVEPLITGIVSNYPNPFNPETTIQYSLKDAGNVSIIIYDLAGKLVKRLYSGSKQAGRHSISWNGLNSRNQSVASGVYYVRMKSAEFCDTRKVMLMK